MTGSAADLRKQVLGLTDLAEDLTRGTELAFAAATVKQRVSGPLRVVIAGRANAGKSTLLNALLGERLAQTDAGECTRIFSWYVGGMGYGVRARLHDGTTEDLEFQRDQRHLEISLGGLSAEDVDRLEIKCPTSKLERLTLIDTPGFGSAHGGRSSAELGNVHRGYADAVIYLMRHAHRLDADFLEAFRDPSVVDVSPINAVAVLSRADEVGGARLGALESAAAITKRYAADPQIRRLVFAVLPLSGLLAETGRTLRESEVSQMRVLAESDASTLRELLTSVQHFLASDFVAISSEDRQQLLLRLGLFGVRQLVRDIRSGQVKSGPDVAQRLVALSGLHQLQSIIDEQFMQRADVLKSRSGLLALRRLARALAKIDEARAKELEGAVEQIAASSHVLAEIELLHMILAGLVSFEANERAEVERLISRIEPAQKLGLDAGAAGEKIRATALMGIDRWRTRGASPGIDRQTAAACDIVARSYEGIYALPSA